MDVLSPSPSTGIVFLWIPCPDPACAERIGGEAVEKRLAACANIVPGMRSIYRWKGELQRDEETVLVLKTTADRSKALTDLVVASHPYEVPAVSILPVVAGHATFLDWVRRETSEERDGLR